MPKQTDLYKETFVRCLAQARGTQRIREAEQELNRKETEGPGLYRSLLHPPPPQNFLGLLLSS